MTTFLMRCALLSCLKEFEADGALIKRGYAQWAFCPEHRKPLKTEDAAELPQNLTKPDSPDEIGPEAA